jgi:hypothetical protein
MMSNPTTQCDATSKRFLVVARESSFDEGVEKSAASRSLIGARDRIFTDTQAL